MCISHLSLTWKSNIMQIWLRCGAVFAAGDYRTLRHSDRELTTISWRRSTWLVKFDHWGEQWWHPANLNGRMSPRRWYLTTDLRIYHAIFYEKPTRKIGRWIHPSPDKRKKAAHDCPGQLCARDIEFRKLTFFFPIMETQAGLRVYATSSIWKRNHRHWLGSQRP